MEKITEEQFNNLSFKLKRGRGQNSQISKLNQAILELEINEALIIKKDEWALKTSPVCRVSSCCYNKKSILFQNNIKVTCRTLSDDSGWVIQKIQ